jgi:hypothetical protein
MNTRRAVFVVAAAAAAAGVDGASAGPCLPAVGSSKCPADSSGFVFAGKQLVCNCAEGSFNYNELRCADGQAKNAADPATLPSCDAATVPQAAMPCAATGGLRCPAGSAWWQSNTVVPAVNVCFCEGAQNWGEGELLCNQNNVSYWIDDIKKMPSCSAEPAFVKDLPCRADGRLCASGWIWARNQIVCNCINGTVNGGDSINCSGQWIEFVDQLGLCSEGEPTAPPAPKTAAPTTAAPTTAAPTNRSTLPPVAQVACELTVPPSPGFPPVDTTGLCLLPSEEYCCVVAGKKTCITQNSNTCGECACAEGASARPASGAAALLAALLMLAASL